MSASSGNDVIHGAQLPSPRWWRRYRDAPLFVLAALSIAAALVGWTTQYRLDRAANEIAPLTSTDQAASECRAEVELPSADLWIDDPEAAAKVWNANADSLSGPIVLGEDGWAFYNDQVEENFSQSIGRRLLTVSEVSAWSDYLLTITDALNAKGIEFTIQITPSSGSVYPEMLPEWSQPIRGATPLDQVLAASPDLPVIDFRSDLREAKANSPVFTPVNSHWTDWGGYIGWQTYSRCHAEMYPDATPITVPAVSGVESDGVFNEYSSYGVPDSGPQWTKPSYADPLPDVSVTDSSGITSTLAGGSPVDLSLLPASTTNDNAESSQTALILRDSMGNALSGLWDQQYAKTWQIQHRFDDWSNPPNFAELVDQYSPDVVILQFAERHLTQSPTVSSGY